MLWLLGSMVIFAGIAVVMVLTGFVILNLFHRHQDQRLLTLEEIILAAFVGTAFWMLTSGTLSYLGFTFNQIRLLIIPVIVLSVLFLRVKRDRYLFHSTTIRKVIFVFALAFLAGSISLLPLLLKNTFYFASDSITYITIGDFLQTHNFITPIQKDISAPYLHQVLGHQSSGLRMGANFFLALITSWAVSLRAVDVYPSVLAWGIALNLLSISLWMRWGLRASYRVILLALFFMAVTPNAVQISGLIGFFPQTFGTAIFLFAMAILTRVVRLRSFSFEMATLLGVSWAFLLSAYSELLPVLGLVSIFPFFFIFLRSYKRKKTVQFLKMLSFSLLLCLLLSHYELLRFAKVIPLQINAVVGSIIPPDFGALWAAALSAKPMEADWNVGFVLAAVLLNCLFLLGLWRVIAIKQVVVISGFGILAAMAFYYWSISDFNTHKAVWSIYKITQWSSPLLVSLAFWRLQLFEQHKILNGIVITSCMVATISLVMIFNQTNEIMVTYTGSKTPVQEYSQLIQTIATYNKPLAYQLSPQELWPSIFPIYFSMNVPLQGHWNVDYGADGFLANKLPDPSTTLFYCLACPYSNPRNAHLPARAVLIDQPVIYDFNNQVDRPFPYKTLNSRLVFPVSKDNRVCLSIFSLKSGDASLEFTLKPVKHADETNLTIYNKKGWQYKPITVLEKNQNFTLAIPLIFGDQNQLCFETNQQTSTISIVGLYAAP